MGTTQFPNLTFPNLIFGDQSTIQRVDAKMSGDDGAVTVNVSSDEPGNLNFKNGLLYHRDQVLGHKCGTTTWILS